LYYDFLYGILNAYKKSKRGEELKINNVGYNHCHDSDFYIDRPMGSGDNLLLLLKSETIITIDGKDRRVPAGTFFVYRRNVPQCYRCVPGSTFSNDWVHFDFENDEEEQFLSLGLKYGNPVEADDMFFLSFCIKKIASEMYSSNKNRKISMYHYMFLIFSKVSERPSGKKDVKNDNYYEMLSTIRSKIYSRPYEKRSVESTAHEVRMSPSNFQHLYKKYFNVSFINDLIISRTEYAAMLLQTTNLSPGEIAHQSGYNHYAHFVRQFGRRFDMSPTEYRKSKSKEK